jgi:hypothetical protein
MAVTRQAAAPGGAQRSRDWVGCASGGGFEGDAVAEGFELPDVAAAPGRDVDVPVVVIGAEVVEATVGVGE